MITPLEILLDPVSIAVLAMYAVLMIWEAAFPARKLPKVRFWKLRGLGAFAFFFFLSSYLPLFIDPYLEPYRLFDLTNLTAAIGGLVGVCLYEFGVYVWHRAMHKSDFLWRTFHQMHHSAERLDTYGAFYFSPMDMIGWTVLGSICFALLVGLSPQAITVTLLVTNFLGMFQHANIKTPTWLGYIIQRPESHTVHHAKGIHKHNYSDLPIFDILFGTFENPKNYQHQTGFFHGASAKVWQMLTFKDLNKNRAAKKKDALKEVTKTMTLLIVCCAVLSCSKEDNEVTAVEPSPVQVAPKVTAFSPKSGPYGTQVTITGKGFGKDDSGVKVYFNAVETSIAQLADDRIVAEVPKGADSGELKVNVNGETLLAGSFIYEFTVSVQTFTGSTQGLEDGSLEVAKFSEPTDMVEDSQGNLFVVDNLNDVIRIIDPEGKVSIYAGAIDGTAGSEDGFRLDARFDSPLRIAIDDQDNLYITDFMNSAVRKITPEGMVSTVLTKFTNAAGVADKLYRPDGLAVGEDGTLYIADRANERVLKLTPEGQVQHLAGSGTGFKDGQGFQAEFQTPRGMTFGNDGYLYIADGLNHSIRRVSLDGEVMTVAGTGDSGENNGNAMDATFYQPYDVQMNHRGNLIIADSGNDNIRMLSADGKVTKLIGNGEGDTDGGSDIAQLEGSKGLFMNKEGTLFIIDTENHKIKKIIRE
ncbi:MAG: sterol desaturase family protein [Bacteroidota bacterium]